MQAAYLFAVGPLAWAAFTIFFLGIAAQLVRTFIFATAKDPEVVRYLDLRYGLRSILAWIVPFKARSWKIHPLLTVVTFTFHICLILVPVFLSAHVILLDQIWGLDYWRLPNQASDWMTVFVLLCCLFFMGRRLLLQEVRFVTTFQDWIILVLIFLPFLTGFLAYHQWFDYKLMLVVHIISGEILLASIPFTRLSHIFYGPLMRAYIGSEFGKIRKARDW